MIQRRLNSSKAGSRPNVFRVRAVLLFFYFALSSFGGGCAPGGAPPGAEGPADRGFPPIDRAAMSRERARETAELIAAAKDSLEAGSFEPALRLAQSVTRDFPGAPGSSEALGILAQALLALGQPEGAAGSALRLVELLGPEHPRLGEFSLLAAQASQAADDPDGILAALAPFPADGRQGEIDAALEILRETGADFSRQALEFGAESYPASNPLRGFFAAEWSSILYFMGQTDEAVRWAEIARSGTLAEREADIANGVLESRLEAVLGTPLVLGTILPRSEVPPGLLQAGEWILEGIQVALEEFQDELPRPVQLEVLDDQGTPLGGREAVASLQAAGAFGALGLLTQDLLDEAAEARRGEFPLLSPFSFIPPEEAEGVYSLSGPDPGGARMVARMAWDLGLESVAVVRPETQEARVDTRAFREEYEALGGLVPREIVFDSGGTFFQPQFQEVEAILPDGLFLPLAPRDIQLLAPQVTFFGLDTLGVQLLGTSGWTDEGIVQEVESRHTDGVIAATVRLTQDETEAFKHFREAYEAYYQKTLRSQVPAFGYDAAALILTALKIGPRNAAELAAAMEEIENFPGATGNLSVDRGWVTREPLLVRIQDHELIYISRGYE